MAIYHFSASFVSRAKGLSAVAKSAYNSCEKIKNEYDGKTHDYSHKPDHTYSEILLPQNAPDEYKDKAKLWNSVELSEKNKNAQLCRSFDVALPKELTQAENEKLIHDFCKENFADKGMCVQIDIHNKHDNPHAHIMTTLREIDENGKWQPKSYKEYKCTDGKFYRPEQIEENGLTKALKNGKPITRNCSVNDWNEKDTLKKWRENWSVKCNEKLREKGADEITHKSHADLNLDTKPQIHLGSYNMALMKAGKTNERIEQFKAISRLNEKIVALRDELKSKLDDFLAEQKNRLLKIIPEQKAVADPPQAPVMQQPPLNEQIADVQRETKNLIAKNERLIKEQSSQLDRIDEYLKKLTKLEREIKTRKADCKIEISEVKGFFKSSKIAEIQQACDTYCDFRKKDATRLRSEMNAELGTSCKSLKDINKLRDDVADDILTLKNQNEKLKCSLNAPQRSVSDEKDLSYNLPYDGLKPLRKANNDLNERVSTKKTRADLEQIIKDGQEKDKAKPPEPKVNTKKLDKKLDKKR